jgi:hypothetical protein
MDYAGLPYSGKFGFIETRMNWFITHMVAPKEKAVACQECHTRAGRAPRRHPDIYLPGRDRNGWVDRLGGLAIIGAIGAGLVHGTSASSPVARRSKMSEPHLHLQAL